MRAYFSGRVSFTVAYLENLRFEEKSYQQRLADSFREGYGREHPDVVIAVDYSTLDFLVQYRDEIFEGRPVPIVFVGVASSWLQGRKMWPGVTGVAYPVEVRNTLDLALHFHPDTTAVAVITGTSDWEKYWLEIIRSELNRHRDKVKEIDLIGPPGKVMLERIATLPSHAVIFYNLATSLSTTPEIGTFDVLGAASKRLPTYSLLASNGLGKGGVGGVFFDENKEARLTGEMVARALSGERAENIPVLYDTPQVQVDWRELKHWHIPESLLPPGSVILYREPTLWERGRKYFVAGITVIAVQAFLIAALFWQRTRKRRAEAELSKSEERFSKTFRHSPLVVAISRTSDSRFIDVSESFEEQLGWTRDEIIGRTPDDFDLWADADQRATYLKQLRASGSVRALEVTLRRRDGKIRTSLVSAELIEVGGEPCSVSVAADITERKQAEEVLSTVSRRLIDAQEKERTRIARELHDDVNQRLALLAMKLSSLERKVPTSDASIKQSVDEVRQDVSDLGKDVHALSHRLHSSKLEYLGLAAAAGGFCKEFAERHNVEVVFHDDNVPRNLPQEISLSLFRVLQEALQNALKYSGTRRFKATLEGTSNEIHLSVHDSGVGFDPESAMNRQGLGLISMKERLKLVEGRLSIDSTPQCGTTIRARVPLKSDVRTEVHVTIATACDALDQN